MSVAGLIDLAGAAVVGLAVVASSAVLLTVRRGQVALSVLLDLLTAAGLLHLSAVPGYMSAASAAMVLAVRRLVSWGLVQGGKGEARWTVSRSWWGYGRRWPGIGCGPRRRRGIRR
jgi:hypothetical protein